MTVAAEPAATHTDQLTVADPWTDYAPLVNKEYKTTRLGRHIVDWIAYMELGNYADRYIDDCERTLSYVALKFPNVGLEELDDGHLAHALRSKPAPSRRKMGYHLSAFFKWAIRARRATGNPVDLLPRIRQGKRRHRDIFTEAEIADLYALPILDAALMGLLFGAGLRKSEAVALEVRRVTVEHPASVTVIGGKGDKDRTVQLDSEAAQLVRELLLFHPLNPQDRFWYYRPGGGDRIHRDRTLSGTAFDNWWARCLKDAGVRYRNPHMARHSFATRWLRGGGRIETLRGEMGHESIRTTVDLYAHLDETDARADLARIEKARREAKESGG